MKRAVLIVDMLLPRRRKAIDAKSLCEAGSAAGTESQRANYLVRHWRGGLSLPVAYWVNGSLLGMAALLLFRVAGELMGDWELQAAASAALLMLIGMISGACWSVVGIWRSAVRHCSRGGSSMWALVAQVVVVCGTLSFMGRVATDIGPQMLEYAAIALDHDSLGKVEATLANDGQALVLRGAFGTGSARKVARLLDAAPGVRSVVLDSHGGRLREAEHVAELVRRRALDSYVEEQCLSACTYVFLAGVDRAATPNARIGFHRPSFSGVSNDQAGLNSMLAVYRAAGIKEGFLQRVRTTAASSMWYPTHAELIDNGVINRISLGGESAAMSSTLFRSKAELELIYRALPLLAAIDQRFPGTLEQAVDAAWTQHESGALDADINTAVRRIFSAVYPVLLATTDDVGLDGFLALMVNQLSAAKNVSLEACSRYLNAELDVSKTLPREVVEQESAWAMQVLSTPAPAAPIPVPPDLFEHALDVVASNLGPDVLRVVSGTGYEDRPEMRCDSLIAFYAEVQKQPAPARHALLRGLFQSSAAQTP
jgi:hypothetical protein